MTVEEEVAELLPCYHTIPCGQRAIQAGWECESCKRRPAVAERLRERDERKCKPDAGRHYNFAGAARCECGLFVRELHVRERIAALEAENERVLQALRKADEDLTLTLDFWTLFQGPNDEKPERYYAEEDVKENRDSIRAALAERKK